MDIEYAWLGCEPASDDVMHLVGGYKPFAWVMLLRHGTAAKKNPKPSEIGMAADADVVRNSWFYLSAVGPQSTPLDILNTFYLPRMGKCDLAMGSELFDKVQQHCWLDAGYVIPVDSDSIRAHTWDYFVPTSEEEQAMFTERMRLELDMWEDIPTESEMLQTLCERYPAPLLPMMYAVVLPRLLCEFIHGSWEADQIVFSLSKETWIGTRNGRLPVTQDVWQRQPIIRFGRNYLVPHAVARLFDTKESDPPLTWVKPVIVRF